MSAIQNGSIIKVNNIEWIVLDVINENEMLCLTKDIIHTMCFDENGVFDYEQSEIKQWISDKFGNTAGLLTDNECQRYKGIIEKYPVNNEWWTATVYVEYLDFDEDYLYSAHIVEQNGKISSAMMYDLIGVRPFCIFKSSILVS